MPPRPHAGAGAAPRLPGADTRSQTMPSLGTSSAPTSPTAAAAAHEYPSWRAGALVWWSRTHVDAVSDAVGGTSAHAWAPDDARNEWARAPGALARATMERLSWFMAGDVDAAVRAAHALQRADERRWVVALVGAAMVQVHLCDDADAVARWVDYECAVARELCTSRRFALPHLLAAAGLLARDAPPQPPLCALPLCAPAGPGGAWLVAARPADLWACLAGAGAPPAVHAAGPGRALVCGDAMRATVLPHAWRRMLEALVGDAEMAPAGRALHPTQPTLARQLATMRAAAWHRLCAADDPRDRAMRRRRAGVHVHARARRDAAAAEPTVDIEDLHTETAIAPCLRGMYARAADGGAHLSYDERTAWVSTMLGLGYTEDTVRNAMMHLFVDECGMAPTTWVAKGYDAEVASIADKGLVPMSCRRMVERGLCPFAAAPLEALARDSGEAADHIARAAAVARAMPNAARRCDALREVCSSFVVAVHRRRPPRVFYSPVFLTRFLAGLPMPVPSDSVPLSAPASTS